MTQSNTLLWISIVLVKWLDGRKGVTTQKELVQETPWHTEAKIFGSSLKIYSKRNPKNKKNRAKKMSLKVSYQSNNRQKVQKQMKCFLKKTKISPTIPLTTRFLTPSYLLTCPTCQLLHSPDYLHTLTIHTYWMDTWSISLMLGKSACLSQEWTRLSSKKKWKGETLRHQELKMKHFDCTKWFKFF